MKHILVGTNRPGSRSAQVARIVQRMYADAGENIEILDLSELPYTELTGANYGSGPGLPAKWQAAVDKVGKSDGIVFIVPEYNGGMPGALKYFIDHWKYPETFENRPVCYIGLGGMFGGLRSVEHLQQVMGYRNAYQFPPRIFLMNIFKTLQNGELTDNTAVDLLKKQAIGFIKFTEALRKSGLDANTLLAKKP